MRAPLGPVRINPARSRFRSNLSSRPRRAAPRQKGVSPVPGALAAGVWGQWGGDWSATCRSLSFFAFPPVAEKQDVIERYFVEVRRRTRPMVCFVNVESVDRIIYSIFQRFNPE